MTAAAVVIPWVVVGLGVGALVLRGCGRIRLADILASVALGLAATLAVILFFIVE